MRVAGREGLFAASGVGPSCESGRREGLFAASGVGLSCESGREGRVVCS